MSLFLSPYGFMYSTISSLHSLPKLNSPKFSAIPLQPARYLLHDTKGTEDNKYVDVECFIALILSVRSIRTDNSGQFGLPLVSVGQ